MLCRSRSLLRLSSQGPSTTSCQGRSRKGPSRDANHRAFGRSRPFSDLASLDLSTLRPSRISPLPRPRTAAAWARESFAQAEQQLQMQEATSSGWFRPPGSCFGFSFSRARVCACACACFVLFRVCSSGESELKDAREQTRRMPPEKESLWRAGVRLSTERTMQFGLPTAETIRRSVLSKTSEIRHKGSGFHSANRPAKLTPCKPFGMFFP